MIHQAWSIFVNSFICCSFTLPGYCFNRCDGWEEKLSLSFHDEVGNREWKNRFKPAIFPAQLKWTFSNPSKQPLVTILLLVPLLLLYLLLHLLLLRFEVWSASLLIHSSSNVIRYLFHCSTSAMEDMEGLSSPLAISPPARAVKYCRSRPLSSKTASCAVSTSTIHHHIYTT